MPPVTFGQDMFSSSASMPSSGSRIARRARRTPPESWPAMLMTSGAPSVRSCGSTSRDVRVDAGVRQPDGVQHAPGRLGETRRRVSGARLQRDRLDDDEAERAHVVERLELQPLAEGPRRRAHGVGQGQASEAHGEVDVRVHRRCRGIRSRSPLYTPRSLGPSVLVPLSPWPLYPRWPRHAPFGARGPARRAGSGRPRRR